MTERRSVMIRFKDVENDDAVREALERRCHVMGETFPETMRLELTFQPNAGTIEAHAHATGKATNVAAHASAPELRPAGERALDRLERELRREHDKRIFKNRRTAQKATGKRT